MTPFNHTQTHLRSNLKCHLPQKKENVNCLGFYEEPFLKALKEKLKTIVIENRLHDSRCEQKTLPSKSKKIVPFLLPWRNRKNRTKNGKKPKTETDRAIIILGKKNYK